MSKLFTGAQHALVYAKYRPTYTSELYAAIVEYCRQGTPLNKFSKALDAGCGTGQSTVPLLEHFQSVVGIDPSETQLDGARKTIDSCAERDDYKSRAVFERGTAEEWLPNQADNSLDLITCAQAIHWVDTDAFYPQVQRVLRPGGVLAAYGYGNVKTDSETANDVIWQFYTEKVGKYWDSRRSHIDNHLSFFNFPMSDFKRLEHLSIVREMPLSSFVGYVSTWSAYQTYQKHNPDSRVLEELQERLCEIFGTTKPEEKTVQAKWPLFILLGRKSS